MYNYKYWMSYNDVNNQQDVTTFSFINPFNSALHVSGYKFAHSQEQFLIVYTAFGSPPTLLPTSARAEMEEFHFNRGTSRQQCWSTVPQAVYTVKKCS